MCDSVAYCISRTALNQLFASSIGLANLGLRLMDHQFLQQENWLISSGSPRAKERYPQPYQRDSGIIAICTFKTYCVLLMDNSAVAKVGFGRR